MTESLPIIAAKHPFKVEVKPGQKYFWCSCGASNNQPFCDGSHKQYKNEDGTSIMKSVMFEVAEEKIVNLCGCKRSKNGVFCDGAHNSL